MTCKRQKGAKAAARLCGRMSRSTGFTVAEMLIAIGLASMIMMMIMSGFYMAYDLLLDTRGRTEAHHQIRAAFRMLRDDLAMAMEDDAVGGRGIFIAAHSQADPWSLDPIYWGHELASLAAAGGYTGPKILCPPKFPDDYSLAYPFFNAAVYSDAMT